MKVWSEEDVADERYLGEMEEAYETVSAEFFTGESTLLQELIDEALALVDDDLKAQYLLKQIIEPIQALQPAEKLLIFTEYTATQEHLDTLLSEVFGPDKVSLINGSMTHGERGAAIEQFEGEGLFLISTEAGGEGINLQRRCHIMINYDLPWNPMRLVQRIGRLYRYGQEKRVIIFNMQQEDSLDQNIVNLMYERLDRVVDDLAQVQAHEYHEGLKNEILGDLAESLDMEDILEQATREGISRTRERIDQALQQARQSVEKQHELFSHAATSDPNELKHQLAITPEHLYSFLRGMLEQLQVEIIRSTHKDRRIELRLTEELKQKMGLHGDKAQTLAVTFDRVIAASHPNTQLLALDTPLMKHLLREAQSTAFGGQTAAIKTSLIRKGALFAGLLRWQNPLGIHQRQEFAVIQTHDEEQSLNARAIDRWLLNPAESTTPPQDQEDSHASYVRARKVAEDRLAQRSNPYLIPQGVEWLAAGWVEGD